MHRPEAPLVSHTLLFYIYFMFKNLPAYIQQLQQSLAEVSKKRNALSSIPLYPGAEGWEVLQEETSLQVQIAEFSRLWQRYLQTEKDSSSEDFSPEGLQQQANTHQHPQTKSFLTYLAHSLAGRPGEAMQALRQACTQGAQPHFYSELNLVLQKTGHFQDGINVLFQALEVYPSLPERGFILQNIFQSRFDHGDLRGAWDALAEAQSLYQEASNPSDWKTEFLQNQLSFAELYAKGQSNEDAEKLANQVLSLDVELADEQKGEADLAVAKAYMILGDLAMSLKKIEIARNCYKLSADRSKNLALIGDPKAKLLHADAHYGVGNSFLVARDFAIAFVSFEQAMIILEEAAVLDPLSALPVAGTLFLNLGSFYHNVEDRNKMHDNYLRGTLCKARMYSYAPETHLRDLAEGLSFLFRLAIFNNEFAEALPYLKASVELFKNRPEEGAAHSPELAEIYRQLGICHRELENWDLALEQLQYAETYYQPLSVEQANPYLLYYCKTFISLAMTYAARLKKEKNPEDREKAIAAGQKAIEIARMQPSEPVFQEELHNATSVITSLN